MQLLSRGLDGEAVAPLTRTVFAEVMAVQLSAALGVVLKYVR